MLRVQHKERLIVHSMVDEPPTIRLADMAKHYRVGPNLAPRRTRVLLNIDDTNVIRGHTKHIGKDRLVISSPQALDIHQECAVFFGLTIQGQLFTIIGMGRVTACTHSDAEGYRVELNFMASDRKSHIALEQLFGSEESNRV